LGEFSPIGSFGHYFIKITELAHIFSRLSAFLHGKSKEKILTKKIGATFWAVRLQTRLVTLVATS
jgi:hypothetical protein